MSCGPGPTNQTIRFLFSLTLLVIVSTSVLAQETKVEKRPALDVTGNKVFSKPELLGVVNSQLDSWTKNGGKYETAMLDYTLHQMEQFMRSHGYLQAKVTKGDIEQTEAGPQIVLAVVEGPLYRVGKMTIDGARLLSTEEVMEVIGLKTGDIANGQKLSDGIFQRLKARYAKFGYVQYTAEVDPTFSLKDGAQEGVVDFQFIIDEGDQFRVHSIKLVGAEASLMDSLKRELLLRAGDIFDDELFRESIARMNRTGLVDPIDDEKDVHYTDLQDKERQLANKRGAKADDLPAPPLLDLVITVKKASLSARDRN